MLPSYEAGTSRTCPDCQLARQKASDIVVCFDLALSYSLELILFFNQRIQVVARKNPLLLLSIQNEKILKTSGFESDSRHHAVSIFIYNAELAANSRVSGLIRSARGTGESDKSCKSQIRRFPLCSKEIRCREPIMSDPASTFLSLCSKDGPSSGQKRKMPGAA